VATIDVDLSALREFTKALRDELNLSLYPQLHRIVDSLDPGYEPFHAKDGFLELQAAHGTYHDCRVRTVQILFAFAQATEALAAAAEQVAQQYGASDAQALTSFTSRVGG